MVIAAHVQPPELRDYQLKSVAKLGEGLRAGHTRQLLSAATGSGKTVIAAHMLRGAAMKGSRVGFLVDRVNLVDQTSRQLVNEFGLYHGIIQGSPDIHPDLPVQVASMQTLERREEWPKFDLLFVDECHDIRRKIMGRIIEDNITTIGLTATPMTKGLGKIYSQIVTVTTTSKLLDDGWLTPLITYPAFEVDMTSRKPNRYGEWTQRDASEEGIKIIGDIVSEYIQKTNQFFGGPVRTLAFSADTKHGAEICRAFEEVGIDFRQSTFRDSDETTRELTKGFAGGEFTGLVSVDKFKKGYDLPSVECLILARPYRRSLASVLQELGRGMRLHPGKDFCLVLDFAGNTLGFREEISDFFAEGVYKLDSSRWKNVTRKERGERAEALCICGAVIMHGSKSCGGCGKPIRSQFSGVRVVPGELRRLDLTAAGSRRWIEDRTWTWEQCCAIALEWRDGDFKAARRTALGFYKGIYGDWPDGRRFKAANGKPDRRVVRRVRANNDAFKQQRRAEIRRAHEEARKS